MFEDIDELARGLAQNQISRRQALRWAGAGALATALCTVGFSGTAEALTLSQRRMCRSNGGTPVERGECNCAFNCGPLEATFDCDNNPICSCAQTIEGRGFCADFSGRCPEETCSSSSECPSGWKCIVTTCCPVGHNVCAPSCPPSTR